MYEAVKKIKQFAAKEKLIAKTKEGHTSKKKKQSEFIAKYFENIFCTNATPMQNVLTTLMSKLFTSSKIRKSIWTLKNNKIPGMDQINVELIKCSPEVVYEKIANIYHNIAATGKHPKEITHGILRALQKPGKPTGPTPNL